MKILAMYLPQFHRVKENDEWWGEGFTDWVSARNARPFFEGHYQPHVPLNNNYYDLSNIDALRWQSELMKKYSVDGLCFYHYYFENGRKLLEKPAEMLLANKDIDMPFCFSWANETWARSWGNIKESNVWSNLNEPKEKSDKVILLNQNYGDIKQWNEHFDYLLPFFQDPRYIKVDGKPLFLIYKVKLIGCIKEMIEYWRELALKNGFTGLYIIGSNFAGNEVNYFDAKLITQPQNANRVLTENIYYNGVKRINCDDVWDQIINYYDDDKSIYGGFVGYDDTPRRGIEGTIIENNSPKLFGENLAKLLAKNRAAGNNLVFINAWNEWGEGMHLEPDEKYGFSFLEQIIIAKKNYKNIILRKENKIDINSKALKIRAEKFELYYNDMDIWMSLKENKISLASKLKEKNIRNVAIYGYGLMGKHLLNELKDSDISCDYIIDTQKSKIHTCINVFSPSEDLPYVDIIIISSYYYINDIIDILPYPSMSLGSLLHEVYNEFVGE